MAEWLTYSKETQNGINPGMDMLDASVTPAVFA
jgi:hypothetical protein